MGRRQASDMGDELWTRIGVGERRARHIQAQDRVRFRRFVATGENANLVTVAVARKMAAPTWAIA
jgi:hypothetical protein